MIGSTTRKNDALERLSTGIARLTCSEAWQAWLRMQARFHQYSFSNTVLLLAQDPAATRVAGFHMWRRLGRHVCHGQSALWILAPITRRVAADDVDDQPADARRVVTAFRAVPVFDVAQTEGSPLPEVCTRLSGDDSR